MPTVGRTFTVTPRPHEDGTEVTYQAVIEMTGSELTRKGGRLESS
jgi:hypothetical protein